MSRPKSNNKCQIAGCEDKHYAKLYCYKHYGRYVARPRAKKHHYINYRKKVIVKSEKFDNIYGTESIHDTTESKNNIPLTVLYPNFRKLPALITV